MFVVPDGAVNLVPLAALPVVGGRYLLEDGPVIELPLSGARPGGFSTNRSWKPCRGLLLCGGPAFAGWVGIRLSLRYQH